VIVCYNGSFQLASLQQASLLPSLIMKVKVLIEELVKPASSTPSGILELSALDQVNARFHSPPVLGFIPALPDGEI
jgi:hypothetical protein